MGAYFVDALRNEISDWGDWRYYANGADGEKVVVRYSWMTRVPNDTYTGYGDPWSSFEPLGASARAVVIKAMDMLSAVCGVTFTKADTATEANLLIGSWNIPGNTAGYAEYPIWDAWSDSRGNVSQLWLDTEWGGVGSLSTALHELGHTLGLKHPFEGDLQLPEKEDLSANTVMSYSHDIDPQKLGLFDVIALQSIYGPAAKRVSDNTYIFGKDKLIWDGGGYDQIDASGAAAKVTLSLQDGSWNYAGSKSGSLLAEGQVWLGNFSLIEAAKGSRFGDQLMGNALNNRLEGNDGSDVLSGREGNDRLYGGDGDDQFNGGAGMDYLVGGYGADTVVYSADAPSLSVTLQGSSEAVVSISGPNNDDTVISIENITGGDVGDRLIGDSRANELRGKGGNDVLSGREGDDRLYAGSGWDKLYGGSGQDHLFGGTDNAGDDFVFSSRSHSTVGSAHDVVYNFTRGSDNIDLRDIDARPSSEADDTFAWSDTAAAAHSVWWKATSEGVLLRADTTGNTTADFEVLLQGLTSFESGDVLL